MAPAEKGNGFVGVIFQIESFKDLGDNFAPLGKVQVSRMAKGQTVGEIFTAEFDGAWDERGLFLLTMHPHITGHRSRMPVLERRATRPNN